MLKLLERRFLNYICKLRRIQQRFCLGDAVNFRKEGIADAESLQRSYAISFSDSSQLSSLKKLQDESAKRDHRKIGKEQELFYFDEFSPGSCYFMPNGFHICKTLIELIRTEYRKRGFKEVGSPDVYKVKLWEKSGHWQHYSENMFSFEANGDKFAMKPMNCPGHCLLFGKKPRSGKEMPVRFADFGVLHRDELSGALTGLTRMRRFQQDDGHIFCRPDQIQEEINSSLDFMKYVYNCFGFSFKLKLSTRPGKFLGDVKVWDEAERQLKESLDHFGEEYEVNPGDGAFYGPKIDITIMDALKRPHQCATIQLDFQLPERFDLTYVSTCSDGEKERPVIIHRAILGSVERMFAILCEHFAGKWPFWLSPRQCMVIPVTPEFNEYAHKVKNAIFEEGFECDDDLNDGDTMKKKIKSAQLAQYNFILVVGEKEQTNGTVNVRTRSSRVHGAHALSYVIERMKFFKESKVLDSDENF